MIAVRLYLVLEKKEKQKNHIINTIENQENIVVKDVNKYKMKSITNQYRDLKEGKLSQFNFMRNLRMSFPQYITNTTSFNDSIKILKNKGLLSEGNNIVENSSNDLQSIFLKYVEDPDQASEYVELFNQSKFNDLPDFLVSNLQNDEEFNDLMQVSKYEDEEKGKEAVMGQFDENLKYDQHDLEQVKALAKEISAKEGVVQHVNRIGKNKYEISDWYDSGTTIISFEDGKIFNDYSDEYEGNRDEEYVDSFGGKMFDNDEDDDNHDTWSDAIKEGSDKKPKLTAAQVNPVELRMGIKIEMEHTNDPKKAEKIALDHLSENPVYYTMLHLSGIEATTAPKVKEEKPKKKKKESIELVDKANQMKKVKIVKEAVDEVPNDDDSGFQQFKAEKEKEKRVMQATNSEGVTFSVNDVAVAPDGKEIKIVGFTKGKDGKMKASYDEGMYIDVYNLDDLKKKDSFKSGVNLGSSFDKFKSKLKEIVREVINEIEK